MQIDGANILITGAAGLIGSTTVDLLLRSTGLRRLVLFDNLSRGHLLNIDRALHDARVEFIHGDVRDPGAVAGAMRGIDAVLHLAALRITACAAEPREAMQVMCLGSFNVVDAARAAGVRRIVAASSASVYGQATQFPTAETHPPYHDDTLYGATKLLLEGLLRSYRTMHGLEGMALRYFNVYGPRMDVHGRYTEVLIRWIERIHAGEPPLILGDGLQRLDFVFIDDVARANVLALQADVAGEAVNIGSGIETSLYELAELLLDVMHSPLQPLHGPERGVSAVRRRLADVRKARRLLGFESEVGLRQGLARLVEWWMAQRRTEVLAA